MARTTIRSKTARARVASTRRSRTAARVDDLPPRILQIAAAHFFQFGFARFTMDDLAAELGMSKKTLYRYFRSKDELIDALIAGKGRRIRDSVERIFAAPHLSFAACATQVMQQMQTELGAISVIFLRDLQRFAPASYAKLETMRATLVPLIWERLLNDGIASGAVRPDLDVPFTAQFVLVALQSLLLPGNLDRLHLQPRDVPARVIHLLVTGLLTPAGRSTYEKERATPRK